MARYLTPTAKAAGRDPYPAFSGELEKAAY